MGFFGEGPAQEQQVLETTTETRQFHKHKLESSFEDCQFAESKPRKRTKADQAKPKRSPKKSSEKKSRKKQKEQVSETDETRQFSEDPDWFYNYNYHVLLAAAAGFTAVY